VTVADGAPVAAEPASTASQPATATVSARSGALVAILARTGLSVGEAVTVTGDAGAVAQLHAWTDRVQGIPAAG
jgi:hypothetical protein